MKCVQSQIPNTINPSKQSLNSCEMNFHTLNLPTYGTNTNDNIYKLRSTNQKRLHVSIYTMLQNKTKSSKPSLRAGTSIHTICIHKPTVQTSSPIYIYQE